MRREIAQQLRFENATDLVAAVGVPLPSLIFWIVIAACSMELGLREYGYRLSVIFEIAFCIAIACSNLLFTLFAAALMHTYADKVLRQFSERLPQILQEFCARPECPPECDADTLTDSPPVIPAKRCIREMGMRFGQWCNYVNVQSAPADFSCLKGTFLAFMIIFWFSFLFVVPSYVPTLAPEWLTLLTISGYMSFNMGYRIGVRRALLANLALLGVVPAPDADPAAPD